MLNRRQLLFYSTAAAPLFSSSVRSWATSGRSEPLLRADRVSQLTRLLVETPADQVLKKVAMQIKNGLPQEELLAALTQAGVQHVEPYPTVGFKYHTVLMLSAVYRTALMSPVRQRWTAWLWAVDIFKDSQQRDTFNGDWKLSDNTITKLPLPHIANQEFIRAMNSWDTKAADNAIIKLSRLVPAPAIFEHLFFYGARDFRDIGHKVIAVSNCHLLLNIIGWQFAEPVLRSTVYALLNHDGEPNPANSDLTADRSWRLNKELQLMISMDSKRDRHAESISKEVLIALRESDYRTVGRLAVDLLNASTHEQTLWDAAFLGAGEIMMQTSGIIGVHANTSINALHYAYQHSQNATTRHLLLLQALSYLAQFKSMYKTPYDRQHIDTFDEMTISARDNNAWHEVFDDISDNRSRAAAKVRHLLNRHVPVNTFLALARRYTVEHNTGYHDYKFTEAALENTQHISPQWQPRYLGSSVFYLNGSKDRKNAIIEKAKMLGHL